MSMDLTNTFCSGFANTANMHLINNRDRVPVSIKNGREFNTVRPRPSSAR